MTSLARRQLAIAQTILSHPGGPGVDVGFTFGVHEARFEITARGRTFESFIGIAGEMDRQELTDVIDRLIAAAQAEPGSADASPRLRYVEASMN